MRTLPPVLRPLLLAALAFLLAGCPFMEPEPEPLPPPLPAVVEDNPPTPLFAGEADLPLLADPEASAARVGSLALNEELLRYRTFQGYAYVVVRDSGAEGWVDNSLLIPQPTIPKVLPQGEDIPPENSPSGALPSGRPPEDQGPISETF